MIHFLLHPVLEIARPAVHPATGKVAYSGFGLATVKGFGPVVVAGFFEARSLPEIGCSFPVADLSDLQTCLVIADPAIAAAGPFSVAGSDFVAAVVVVAGFSDLAAVVAFAADLVADFAYFVCPACSVVVATGKGKVAVASYFLIRRSFS